MKHRTRWSPAIAAALPVLVCGGFLPCLAGPGNSDSERDAFPKFRLHEIGTWGKKMGQTSLVDLDNDGDLDWISGSRGGDVCWFEYRGPKDWKRHVIGKCGPNHVGGTAFDVDRDGRIDQVSSSYWFRNTGSKSSPAFTRYTNNGVIVAHDNVAADIDGDGRLDLVAMIDKPSELNWYKIPSDATGAWVKTKIGPGVHGGFDPKGVGDLDGDGDNDIVRSTGWFENRDKGASWVWHENIAGGNGGKYRDTTKAWICDLNRDGHNDVVMTTADSESGKGWVKIFVNQDGTGQRWVTQTLASSKGDLHSLAVADFDNDGDLDVFSGEGPLGGTGPGGKWQTFIWENSDGHGRTWTEHVVSTGYRCHEAVAGDVDGDGDVDICFKPWNGDLHVYLENR